MAYIGIRFDYNAHLQTLFVEMQSDVHEEAIGWLNRMASKTMRSQRLKLGRAMSDEQWTTFPNLTSRYNDNRGRFTADLTFRAKDVSLLYLEVTFSQSRDSVLDKVTRILEGSTVIGVIVISIREASQYRQPELDTSTVSHVDYPQWENMLESAKNVDDNAFLGIHLYGRHWIKDCTCSVQVFYKADGGVVQTEVNHHISSVYLLFAHTVQALLPPSGPIILPELDTLIEALWTDHVYAAAQVCGAVDSDYPWEESDVVPLECDWEGLRRMIVRGMAGTAYARYIEWCIRSSDSAKSARKRKGRDQVLGTGEDELGGGRFKLQKGKSRFNLENRPFKYTKWTRKSA